MNHQNSILNITTLSDEELAHRAQAGAQDAFIQLYERFFPMVYAWARFKVPEPDAEDVTQEIFIAVMKSLVNFKSQSKVSTWLRTITNHKIADYYRARKIKDPVELDDYDELDPQELSRYVKTTDCEQDDFEIIRQSLCQLPANYQDIIMQRFIYEMPFNEIACHNGQSLEATKSLFRRAMAALSMKMENNNG
jgi:RNA polymerase sigma-70 factor (ECF subfamily)